MAIRNKSWLFALSPIVLALAACGGGGGSGHSVTPDPEKPTSEPGLYEGPMTGNMKKTYGVTEGFRGASILFVDGNKRLWGTNELELWDRKQPIPFTATYSLKGSQFTFKDAVSQGALADLSSEFVLNGSFHDQEIALESQLKYKDKNIWNNEYNLPDEINFKSRSQKVSKVNYDYDKSASLDAIAGRWGFYGNSEELNYYGDFEIKSDGQVVFERNPACGLKYQVKPTALGKNYFDVEVTEDPRSCIPVPGQPVANYNYTYTGVVYSYVVEKQEVLVINILEKPKNARDTSYVDILSYTRRK